MKDALKLVTSSDPKAGRRLGKHGQRLWDDVQAEYDVSDAGGSALLMEACLAIDRAERLAGIIGSSELVPTKTSVRAHPLLAFELANRSFAVRTLQRLGICSEPLRSGAGRPGIDVNWKPNASD